MLESRPKLGIPSAIGLNQRPAALLFYHLCSHRRAATSPSADLGAAGKHRPRAALQSSRAHPRSVPSLTSQPLGNPVVWRCQFPSETGSGAYQWLCCLPRGVNPEVKQCALEIQGNCGIGSLFIACDLVYILTLGLLALHCSFSACVLQYHEIVGLCSCSVLAAFSARDIDYPLLPVETFVTC